MGIVHEAIQNGISDSGIPDVFMPVFYGQLSGHNGGSVAMSVFDNFQEIPAFRCRHGGEAKIVEDESFGLKQLLHQLWV